MSEVNTKYTDFILDEFVRACKLHKSCESCLTLEELEFKRDMCIGALDNYRDGIYIKDVTVSKARLVVNIIEDVTEKIEDLFEIYSKSHIKKEE